VYCTAVSITSTADVTVQAASVSDWSTDAYLGLPTDVIGRKYYVLTYLYRGGPTSVYRQGPSEFGVISTGDATRIVIRLSRADVSISSPGDDVTRSAKLADADPGQIPNISG